MTAITELHWPGKTSPFSYKLRNTRKKGRPRRLDILDEGQKPKQLRPGLADCAKGNAAYLRMLEDFGINNLDLNEILLKFITHHDIKTPIDPHDETPENPDEVINDNQPGDHERKQDVESQIIFLRLTQNWSLKSLKAKFELSEEQLNESFNQF